VRGEEGKRKRTKALSARRGLPPSQEEKESRESKYDTSASTEPLAFWITHM
jgi:hypothetical protein